MTAITGSFGGGGGGGGGGGFASSRCDNKVMCRGVGAAKGRWGWHHT